MKTLLRILVLGMVTVLLTLAAKAGSPNDLTDPLASKNKNLFVLKAEKKFVGATLEVIHANGKVIAEQVLQKRKIVIDFDDVKFGAYTIRLKKGNQIREYQYTKK